MPQNPVLYNPMPDLDLEGSSPLSMGGGLQVGNVGSNYVAQQGLHRQLPAPPELTAAQIDALNQQDDRQAWAKNSPFLSGVASGWEGLKAGANGLVGAGQGALGFGDAARASLRRRAADQALQQDYDSGSPAGLKDVHGIGDAFDWAEHQLGAAAPGLAAVLGTTLATVGDLVGLGAGAALRGAGERLGAAAIERGEPKRLSSSAEWVKNGPVYREMAEATKRNGIVAKLFDYIETKDPETASQELFAELAALKTTHPELANEYFPQGTKALEEALHSRDARLQSDVAPPSGVRGGSPLEHSKAVDRLAHAEQPDESGGRVRAAPAAGSDQGAARGQPKDTGLEHSRADDDSLDRVPDDSRSVAETVAAAKKNPAYQALRTALDAARAEKPNPLQRQSKMQAVVN